ncbi:MAG: DUF3467 domain-containing protein [Syntrophales bacterium]|jgi:hypothetical protein|nr:DUF3467 domain-containing protein [Syntrophales bacterium]MCK9528449.1 DUF3467 domain-containing protein [Syntrophales bacterium]MDX9922472.1 DUF3467 domain-containing protein [Syntrophales bacterium]
MTAQKKDNDLAKEVTGTGADDMKTTIKWDVAKMNTSYANVCNVSSTREEFTILFGINKTWNPEQRELTVDMSDRVILNPFAAKRMALLLSNVIRQYEDRYGEISIETGETHPAGGRNA